MYKVLLVDDEYMITEGLKRLIPFEKWDMEVVATANHADEALDYVREHPVDIVISDVNMPDKTGLEMIGEMKELLPEAYYILLSGYQEFEYVKKAMNLNVVDYLVKPVDKVELEHLLEKIVTQLREKVQEPEILSQQLDEEALIQILTEPKNAIIRQYQALFQMENVELEFTQEALVAIAKKAIARKTGARGLRSIVENLLLDTMYDLPTLNAKKVIVSKECVERNEKPMIE